VQMRIFLHFTVRLSFNAFQPFLFRHWCYAMVAEISDALPSPSRGWFFFMHFAACSEPFAVSSKVAPYAIIFPMRARIFCHLIGTPAGPLSLSTAALHVCMRFQFLCATDSSYACGDGPQTVACPTDTFRHRRHSSVFLKMNGNNTCHSFVGVFLCGHDYQRMRSRSSASPARNFRGPLGWSLLSEAGLVELFMSSVPGTEQGPDFRDFDLVIENSGDTTRCGICVY